MPLFDIRCPDGHLHEVLVRADNDMLCRTCGKLGEKVWITPPVVISDTVPGGFWIENLNPTPTYFSSKSEYAAELKRQGKEIGARWVSTKYSDKPPNGLTRWY